MSKQCPTPSNISNRSPWRVQVRSQPALDRQFAESGRFQLIELQAVSGHRDVRMLLRYAHLCSGNLADKMDSVSTSSQETYLHRGRKRKKGKKADGKPLLGAAADESGDISTTPRTVVEIAPAKQGAPLPSNVIAFPVRRVA